MVEKSDILFRIQVQLASGITISGIKTHLSQEQYKLACSGIERIMSGDTAYLSVQTDPLTTVYIPKKLLEDALLWITAE